jgi:hypothetical protein
MKNVTSHLISIALIIGVVIFMEQGYAPVEAHKKIYILCSVFGCIAIAFQIYKKEIIDRIVLALTLWAVGGTMAFLGDSTLMRYYYETYRFVILFVILGCIGIVTTLFTRAGFVGVLSSDRKAALYASYKLLGLTILMVVLALYGFDILCWLPLIWYKERLQKQLRGEKVWSWSFKWNYDKKE